MQFEYVISAGEGTLIDYGVCDNSHMNRFSWNQFDMAVGFSATGDIIGHNYNDGNSEIIRWRPCDNECETGSAAPSSYFTEDEFFDQLWQMVEDQDAEFAK